MASVATVLIVVIDLMRVSSLTWGAQRARIGSDRGDWSPWGLPWYPRAADPWNHGDGEHRPFASNRPPNLIYIKVPKAASSTTGGVARRIAARHGLGCVHDGMCDWTSEPSVSAHHRERRYMESLGNGLRKPIVWMASLRDPLSQCMSMFYHFEAGLHGVSDTTENKLNFLKSPSCRNYQWNFLCPGSICKSNDTERALEAYSFIVLVERFDESMALLIATLGVSMSDVLYLEAKGSSNFPVPHRNFEDEPAEVQAFGGGEEFKAQNQLDYKLWEMVHDRIDSQMVDQVNQEIYANYTRLLKKARSTCFTNCTWNFDDNLAEDCGDCYWNDNGCGYTCFDAMSAAG